MANPDSSGHNGNPGVVEISELANSLAASKEEAISVLGSALADQVVGALVALGLVPYQNPLVGGQPMMRSNDHPYHMIGQSLSDLTLAHTQLQQPGGLGYSMAPFFFHPRSICLARLSSVPRFSRPNVTSVRFPLVCLGPPNQVHHHQGLLHVQVK